MRLDLQFEMRVPAKKLVRDMRRAARKHHSAENEIRIVMPMSALKLFERRNLQQTQGGSAVSLDR
jgi:hypothetical protein